jgi:hypothetical protein
MQRLNEEISKEKEMELLQKLFEETTNYFRETMGDEDFFDFVEREADDCIDCCEGKDGKTYFWLVDSGIWKYEEDIGKGVNACIDMEGNVYEGDDEVYPIFGMTWSEESNSWL